MARRQYTDEQENQMVTYYRAGWSLSEIERLMGIPQTTVRSILKRRKVELRPVGSSGYQKVSVLSNSEIERTAELYQSGLSLGEVGKIVGRAQGSVRWRLRLAGVPIRSRSEAGRLAYESGRKKRPVGGFGADKKKARI